MNTEDSFGAAAVAVSEEAEETSSTNGGGNTYDVAKRDEITDLGFRTEHTKNGFLAYEILGDRRVPENGEGFGTINELVVAVREEVQKTGVSSEPAVDDFEAVELSEADEADELDAGENIIDADEIDPDEAGPEQFEELGEQEDLPQGAVELTEEPNTGQIRLPGQARVVCQELTDAALKYHAIKTERVMLTAKETAAKDELKMAVAKNASFLTKDPDNSDAMIYVAGQTADGKNIVVRDQKKYEEKITTEVEDPKKEK